MKKLALPLLLLAAAIPLRAIADESPIVSSIAGFGDDAKTVAAAKELGAASAAKDIKSGTFRILAYGLVDLTGQRDPETGYHYQVVAGTILGNAFHAEVDAYNATMRDWHAKTKSTNHPK